MACVSNLTPVPRENFLLGVPEPGVYREQLNTDRRDYDGSGVVNSGPLRTEERGVHGRSHSLRLTLPPLATLILQPVKPGK